MRSIRQHQRNGSGHDNGPEPRVVRIEYRPVPDGERRLRRVAPLLPRPPPAPRPPPGAGGGAPPEVQ